jgi:hypothetical protein
MDKTTRKIVSGLVSFLRDCPVLPFLDSKSPREFLSGLSPVFMNSKVVVRNDKQEMHCCRDAPQMAFWDPLTSVPMTSSDESL